MALPGHRRTSSHKRRRAAHFALKKHSFITCPHCKALTLPHTVCKQCGYLGAKLVVNKTKKKKKAKKTG